MFELDVNEPTAQALSLIGPALNNNVHVSALNVNGWADYRWQRLDGVWVNAERKTWPEILANVDAVEDQLRRHIADQPKAIQVFILEGWVEESMMGTHVIQQMGKGNGNTLYGKGRASATRLNRIYSWLYSASQYVNVMQTGSFEQTCQMLVQMYKQDNKEETEKKIFSRYYKQTNWHPDPMVLKLIGIEPGLGEVRATALIARFSTVWNVLSATPKELTQVPGIGMTIANKLLSGVGRSDV